MASCWTGNKPITTTNNNLVQRHIHMPQSLNQFWFSYVLYFQFNVWLYCFNMCGLLFQKYFVKKVYQNLSILCCFSNHCICFKWSGKFNASKNSLNQSHGKKFPWNIQLVQTLPLDDAKAKLSIHSTSHARFYGHVLCLILFWVSAIKSL